MYFGVTGSIAETFLSGRFRSLLGIRVAYIIFTILLGEETSSVPLCSLAGVPRLRRFAIPFPYFRRLICPPV